MKKYEAIVCCGSAIDLVIYIYQINEFVFQCKRCGKIYITKLKGGKK